MRARIINVGKEPTYGLHRQTFCNYLTWYVRYRRTPAPSPPVKFSVRYNLSEIL